MKCWMTVLGLSVAVLGFAGGCATDKTHVNAESLKTPGVVGTWRGDQGREVTIVKEGDAYGIEGAGPNGEPRHYPMRVLRIGDTDIAEIEIDRKQEGEALGIGYLYGRLAVTGNSLEYRRLKRSWLEGRAPSEGMSVSPLESGKTALAVGNAKEMKSMLEGAVADTNAWDGPELWSRVR